MSKLKASAMKSILADYEGNVESPADLELPAKARKNLLREYAKTRLTRINNKKK